MAQVSAASSSPLERALRLLTVLRPGEGRCVLLFAAHGFLVMASYYVVKALREAFLLGEAGAEIRSYTVAVNGLVLMLLVPLYSAVRRRIDGPRLILAITWFFAGTLLMFAVAGALAGGTWFGVGFFLWVGVYGLFVIAQFWALAASAFNTKSGQRLFPAIMLGANLGALAGAQAADVLILQLAPVTLLGVGAVLLAATTALVSPELASIPVDSRSRPVADGAQRVSSVLGGFKVVFTDRYLLLIAAFVVLLNCVGSTGDYVLASLIRDRAAELAGADPTGPARDALIGSMYARFFFWVTLAGVLLQMLVVSRVYRHIGVRGALLVLPALALCVYGGIAFVPVFTLVWLLKVAENATNYSLMNTTQQALYLPTGPAAKFDGKTTIDTFFWRFGDILQAGVIFVALNVFSWTSAGLALFNAALCVLWIALAWLIGIRYTRLARAETRNTPPVHVRAIPDLAWRPGERLEHVLHAETFADADPGDVLVFQACLADGAALPKWLSFDRHHGRLAGVPPPDAPHVLSITVTATDIDGASVTASVTLVRAAAPDRLLG